MRSSYISMEDSEKENFSIFEKKLSKKFFEKVSYKVSFYYSMTNPINYLIR